MRKSILSAACAALSVLVALIMCIGAVEAAPYGYVKEMTGNYLRGAAGSPTKNAEIPIPTGSTSVTMNVTAHFGTNTTGTNTGRKIKWQAQATGASSSAEAAITSPAPGGTDKTVSTKMIGTEDYESATISFTNVSPSSAFTVTAKLLTDGDSEVSGSHGVVNVTFVRAVDVTSGEISRATATVRQEGTLELQAFPVPRDATIREYRWETLDSTSVSVGALSASSQDLGLVTGVAVTATPVKVSCTMTDEAGNKATVSCMVSVVASGTIADDMVISGDTSGGGSIAGDNSDSSSSTTVYGVNDTYYTSPNGPFAAYELTNEKIAEASGVSGADVRYVVGSPAASEKVSLNVNRSSITGPSGLNIQDYTTNVVSAMRVSADITPKEGKTGMVPIMLQYNFPSGMRYADRATVVERPSSASDFNGKYIIRKYFTKDAAPVDISAILDRKMGGQYMVHDETTKAGEFRVGPMIMIVNALAPQGDARYACDEYRGENKQYGVRYDSSTNILFIYDGDPDDNKAYDPVVLERRPVTSSGGGGGCATGAGIALAAAVLIATRRR